jgi:hypothetical protein
VQFIARMIRAAKLEPHLYEEVKTDTYATSQALVVVLLSSLAASIGAFTHAGPGSPGLRFSLPPCGCSLPRLLQYGRQSTIRARYVLLACVFLVGWCTYFSCSSCYCCLAKRG